MNSHIHNKKEEIKKLILELDELARKESDHVEISIDIECIDESRMYGCSRNSLGNIYIKVRTEV